MYHVIRIIGFGLKVKDTKSPKSLQFFRWIKSQIEKRDSPLSLSPSQTSSPSPTSGPSYSCHLHRHCPLPPSISTALPIPIISLSPPFLSLSLLSLLLFSRSISHSLSYLFKIREERIEKKFVTYTF